MIYSKQQVLEALWNAVDEGLLVAFKEKEKWHFQTPEGRRRDLTKHKGANE